MRVLKILAIIIVLGVTASGIANSSVLAPRNNAGNDNLAGHVLTGNARNNTKVSSASSAAHIQEQVDYLVPIIFNNPSESSHTSYSYQQLIEINRTYFPEINPGFSNIFFSYANGSLISAWVQNVSNLSAYLWLRLSYASKIIYMEIVGVNDSLFNSTGSIGSGVRYFNAPEVFGNSTSPNAWDFAGTSLPAGFVNHNTNYTVDNGLYISGRTAHYAYISIPGTYGNNTGILADMQISSNGHNRIGQLFLYPDNGTKTQSFNFWYFYNDYFYFASEGRGPYVDTGISNYSYNVLGINDSLNTNKAYGTFNNQIFSNQILPYLMPHIFLISNI